MLIVEFDQLQAELKTGVLEQVAMLERLCLADDHWEVAAIASMLEQYGAGLLLAVDDFEGLHGGDVPTIRAIVCIKSSLRLPKSIALPPIQAMPAKVWHRR